MSSRDQPENHLRPRSRVRFSIALSYIVVIDLRPQPTPPLPSVPGLVPSPEIFQIVSNKFYNRLHVLLTANLLGTRRTRRMFDNCQHHPTSPL